MLGIGIGWSNKKASAPPPPTVYSFTIYNCGSVIGTVYSSSNSFAVGNYIYSASNLTSPYNGLAAGSADASTLNIVTNGLITSADIACE
jgi:hypothetical protein